MDEKEIKLTRHLRLKKDTYCMWIEEEKISTRGKNKGEAYWVRISGYFQDYESLYKNFAVISLRGTEEANTATKFLAKMKDVQVETLKQIEKLMEGTND